MLIIKLVCRFSYTRPHVYGIFMVREERMDIRYTKAQGAFERGGQEYDHIRS